MCHLSVIKRGTVDHGENFAEQKLPSSGLIDMRQHSRANPINDAANIFS
jgi:hypothetical protein